MKKKSLMALLIASMVVSMTACGSKSGTENEAGNGTANDTQTQESTDSETSFSVGMVTDTGGVNDQSFNQSAWEGLQSLNEDYGCTINYLESTQESDYPTNLDKMVDAGTDLIWGVGFSMADAIQTAASMNPDQMYGIIDNSYGDDTLDNIICLMFNSQDSSFLVGYIAGLTTETDKVGFVGGISSDIIDQFQYGYEAGVQYAADELGKEIEVDVQYAESFSDAAKGKAIATKMYSDGCDIVFHAAGNAGNGVIEAAKDSGNYVIGVDRDQYDVAPDAVLTSALKKVGVAVELVSTGLMEGEITGGQTIVYGLSDGAVGIPEENPNLDPEVYDKAIEVQNKIVNGEITPPYNAEMFEEFVAQ